MAVRKWHPLKRSLKESIEMVNFYRPYEDLRSTVDVFGQRPHLRPGPPRRAHPAMVLQERASRSSPRNRAAHRQFAIHSRAIRDRPASRSCTTGVSAKAAARSARHPQPPPGLAHTGGPPSPAPLPPRPHRPASPIVFRAARRPPSWRRTCSSRPGSYPSQ